MDTCELDLDKVKRGPSYWKLNSPLLAIEENTISDCAIQVDVEGLEWDCQQWSALGDVVDSKHDDTGDPICCDRILSQQNRRHCLTPLSIK